MSDYATFPDQTLAPSQIPPHLRMSGPPPPPKRSRVFVAAVVAAALLVVGGIGWLLLPREHDPVRLRLSFSEGDSLLYRVESSSAVVMDFSGVGRQIFTEMQGMLRLDVTRARSASAQARSELTLFSFVANGADMSGPKRFRRQVRLSPNGPMLGGLFMTREGWPVLLLPGLTPILPKRPVQPGDERTVRNVLLFSKEEPGMDGTTRFVGFREVQGTRLAVLEGTFTSRYRGEKHGMRGDMQVRIRARLDPSTGRLHDAGGTVDFDGVVLDPQRSKFTSSETFRLLPV